MENLDVINCIKQDVIRHMLGPSEEFPHNQVSVDIKDDPSQGEFMKKTIVPRFFDKV